jgi:hypothetical protein
MREIAARLRAIHSKARTFSHFCSSVFKLAKGVLAGLGSLQ